MNIDGICSVCNADQGELCVDACGNFMTDSVHAERGKIAPSQLVETTEEGARCLGFSARGTKLSYKPRTGDFVKVRIDGKRTATVYASWFWRQRTF